MRLRPASRARPVSHHLLSATLESVGWQPPFSLPGHYSACTFRPQVRTVTAGIVRRSGGGKGAVKIGFQILDILEPDGQPDAAIGNAHRGAVIGADAAVGCRARMAGECL